jgi:methylated-DNA-[protein]-cysteine S-methyltransferase
LEIKYKLFLNLEGTPFQKKVWQELLKIPKGQTRSYKEIAIAIGNPKAARAVANACGKNPYPIKIPCHRAIRSDGSLGGYSGSGGSTTKLKLLIEEKTS